MVYFTELDFVDYRSGLLKLVVGSETTGPKRGGAVRGLPGPRFGSTTHLRGPGPGHRIAQNLVGRPVQEVPEGPCVWVLPGRLKFQVSFTGSRLPGGPKSVPPLTRGEDDKGSVR